jgi:hypothetical protein
MGTVSRIKSVDPQHSDHRATGMHASLYSSIISLLSLIDARARFKGEGLCQQRSRGRNILPVNKA